MTTKPGSRPARAACLAALLLTASTLLGATGNGPVAIDGARDILPEQRDPLAFVSPTGLTR